jgi:hypothetical protein
MSDVGLSANEEKTVLKISEKTAVLVHLKKIIN